MFYVVLPICYLEERYDRLVRFLCSCGAQRGAVSLLEKSWGSKSFLYVFCTRYVTSPVYSGKHLGQVGREQIPELTEIKQEKLVSRAIPQSSAVLSSTYSPMLYR